MLNAIDSYFEEQTDAVRSCFLVLCDVILDLDENITICWKYKAPFFCYKAKMFCYFWTDKKTGEPYIGLVEGNRINHELLERGKRKRMRILQIDSQQDLPINDIEFILTKALDFYRNGIIKI